MAQTKEFLLAEKLPQLDEILAWVRECLAPHTLSSKQLKEFELSLEEATVNVSEHAYQGGGGIIKISFEADPDGYLTFVVTDQGPFFNPVIQAEKIKADRLMGNDEGGLGVYLMCAVMDSVHYKRENNTNVLTLKKKINT